MARFFRRGVSLVKMLPAVAAYVPTTGLGSPTRVEIAAGVDLSQQVADIGGWTMANSPIDVPNLKDRFTPKIPGEDAVGDTTLTMYDLDDSTTIRAAIAKGTSGFIVLFPYGDTATKRCEVWPVTSTGVNDEYTLGNEAARYVAGFAVSNPPNQAGVIPA